MSFGSGVLTHAWIMSIACRRSKAQYSTVKANSSPSSQYEGGLVKETIHVPKSVMDRVYLRQNLTMALAWSAYWPGYNMWINVVQARAHVPRMTRRWATQDRMKPSTSPILSRTGMYLRQNLTTALVWSAYTGQGTACGLMSCRARVHVPGMARRWANLKSNISSYVRHYALPC